MWCRADNTEDEKRSDAFLHQKGGGKIRLKTNLQVHVEHIRDSWGSRSDKAAEAVVLPNAVYGSTKIGVADDGPLEKRPETPSNRVVPS